MNQDILKRMIAARAGLLLDEPFFGVPALRLEVVEDPTCQTAWVNGQQLGYNPAFVASLSHVELKALWIHEVEHCAMGHPWRRDGRDQKEFNVAADLAINGVLREAGYKPPAGALFPDDPEYNLPVGKSVEWYFPRLPAKPKQQGQGGQGQGGQGQGIGANAPAGPQGNSQPPQGGPNTPQNQAPGTGQPSAKADPLGEVRDAPTAGAGDSDEAPPSEEDWRQLMEQSAAMARSRGQLPAALDRAVKASTKSRIDWKPAMRRFAQEVAKADYSWVRPSSRYVARGLYLPSLRSEEVGVVAIGIDTSGSIDQVLLSEFKAEVQAMVDEVQPRKVVVLSCDARVHSEETFERGDPIEMHPVGGGGTDFRPVFDAIAQWEEQPVCVIYLTDLAGTFPSTDPGIPTLWVTAGDDRDVPFGEVLTAA